MCLFYWINSLHKTFMEIVNWKTVYRSEVWAWFVPESYWWNFSLGKLKLDFTNDYLQFKPPSCRVGLNWFGAKAMCEINTKFLPSKVWMWYMSVFLRKPLYFHTTNKWVLNCHSEAVWGYFPTVCLAKASWNSACILQLINGGCWC